MSKFFKRDRIFAAAAAGLAFVATFAVSARAMMNDPEAKVVEIVVVNAANTPYVVGDRVTVTVRAEQIEGGLVKVADGVYGVPVNPNDA